MPSASSCTVMRMLAAAFLLLLGNGGHGRTSIREHTDRHTSTSIATANLSAAPATTSGRNRGQRVLVWGTTLRPLFPRLTRSSSSWSGVRGREFGVRSSAAQSAYVCIAQDLTLNLLFVLDQRLVR